MLRLASPDATEGARVKGEGGRGEKGEEWRGGERRGEAGKGGANTAENGQEEEEGREGSTDPCAELPVGPTWAADIEPAMLGARKADLKARKDRAMQ